MTLLCCNGAGTTTKKNLQLVIKIGLQNETLKQKKSEGIKNQAIWYMI